MRNPRCADRLIGSRRGARALSDWALISCLPPPSVATERLFGRGVVDCGQLCIALSADLNLRVRQLQHMHNLPSDYGDYEREAGDGVRVTCTARAYVPTLLPPLCPLPTPPSVRYLLFLPFSPTVFSLESFPFSKIDENLRDAEIDRWGY